MKTLKRRIQVFHTRLGDKVAHRYDIFHVCFKDTTLIAAYKNHKPPIENWKVTPRPPARTLQAPAGEGRQWRDRWPCRAHSRAAWATSRWCFHSSREPSRLSLCQWSAARRCPGRRRGRDRLSPRLTIVGCGFPREASTRLQHLRGAPRSSSGGGWDIKPVWRATTALPPRATATSLPRWTTLVRERDSGWEDRRASVSPTAISQSTRNSMKTSSPPSPSCLSVANVAGWKTREPFQSREASGVWASTRRRSPSSCQAWERRRRPPSRLLPPLTSSMFPRRTTLSTPVKCQSCPMTIRRLVSYDSRRMILRDTCPPPAPYRCLPTLSRVIRSRCQSSLSRPHRRRVTRRTRRRAVRQDRTGETTPPTDLSTRRRCTPTPVLTQRKSVQRHLTEVGILRRTCWQARRVHNAIRRDPATSRRRERCEWCWSEISGSSAVPSRPSCRRGVEKAAVHQQGLDTRLPQRRPPVGRPRVPSRTLQQSCFSDLLGRRWTEEKRSQAAPSDPFLLEKGSTWKSPGYLLDTTWIPPGNHLETT